MKLTNNCTTSWTSQTILQNVEIHKPNNASNQTWELFTVLVFKSFLVTLKALRMSFIRKLYFGSNNTTKRTSE